MKKKSAKEIFQKDAQTSCEACGSSNEVALNKKTLSPLTFGGRMLSRFRRYYTKRLGAAIAGTIVFLAGFLLEKFGAQTGIPQELVSNLSVLLYLIAYFFAGFYLFLSAIKGLRKMVISYPFLMVSAGASAFALGSYAEGASILILMSLGEWLEEAAQKKVKENLFNLYEAMPSQVTCLRNGSEVRTELKDIKVGDVIISRAGEVVPVDGRVIEGIASLDVASVKGEFLPEVVKEGSLIMAGSVNLDGVLKIEATSCYEASTVSRLYRAVVEALSQKGSYARFFERFSRKYTPMVMLGAILFFLVAFLILGWEASKAFYSSLVIVVVSCPCAFILSTPMATASAMASASRRGILIRGSETLERLATIKAIAVDKTGTLTLPSIFLKRVSVNEPYSVEEVLSYALQLEASSNHPVARAIRSYAEEMGITEPVERVTDIRYQVGGGVEGKLNGKHICIGSLDYVGSHHPVGELKENGGAVTMQTPQVVMFIDNSQVAEFRFAEELREGAVDVKGRFERLGINEIALLSGDRFENVKRLAELIGVKKIHYQLSPDEKLATLTEMKRSFGPTAMVGDGINDSPVLAGADVGIALNTVGNDLVLESADVVVASESLVDLPAIFKLSKRAIRTIKLNTAVALLGKLAFVVVSLILASYGAKSLWLAVLGDDGITFLVAMNSLRLLSPAIWKD